MIAYTDYPTDARVIKEAQTVAKSGMKVDFICLQRNFKEKISVINDILIYRLKVKKYWGNNNFIYFLSYLNFFTRCFFKTSWLYIWKKYEVVHVNNMPDFLVFSTLFPKIFGAKIILDIHDPMAYTFLTKYKVKKGGVLYKLLLIQEIWSAKFADAVITVHEPLKNDILVKDGIPANKISVVANFADGNIFDPKLFNLQDNKLKLIFHGTIAERFGFNFVLKSIANLKKNNQIYLKIIGEGDFEDNLKLLITNLNLQDIVEFENTMYPVNKLPEILQNYQIGLVSYALSPATDYMLPVKMLELYAMGIPSITIPNKAIKFYFTEKEYFPYNPLDKYSLNRLLEKLIQNPKLIIEKRELILKNRQKFLWSNEGKKYLSTLKNLRISNCYEKI